MAAPPPSPPTLFDAVKNDDFDGMVRLYAAAARDSAFSYAALRKRWDGRGSDCSVEEKVDEYFYEAPSSLLSPSPLPSSQHGARHGRNTSSRNNALLFSAAAIRSSAAQRSSSESSAFSRLDDMLRDLDEIIDGLGQHQTAAARPTDETVVDCEYASHPAKKKTRQSSSPRSELLTKQLLSDEESSVTSIQDQAKAIRASTGRTSTEEEEDEIRRVIDNATGMLTNARPPTTFAVFSRDNEYRLEMRERRRTLALGGFHHNVCGEKQECCGDGCEISEEEEADEVEEDRPPIFDGSVANATPGGAGGAPVAPAAAGGQQQQQQQHATGGGTGTVLHLACALDSPFCLAILLAMGGDVLSRHTAFRRLVVHEAACAGSPNCLRLLLELADKYREALSSASRNHNPIWNSFPESTAGHQQEQQQQRQKRSLGPRALFLPPMRTDDGVACIRRPATVAMPYHGILSSRPDNRSSEVNPQPPLNEMQAAEENNITVTKRTSFVDALKLISDLGRQVMDGSLLDLEAGRMLLSRVDVPGTTKAAIVSICHGPAPPSHRNHARASPYMDFLNLPNVVRPRGDADGHGNTPLHWASFKNASECVSVLLSHHADPNARAEPSGWTPLHDAAYSDAAECVDLLVKAAADVDSRANSGATPLCFAAQEDAPEAARLLLEAGADSAVRCAHGGNCIVAAASNPQQNQPHPSRFSGYTPLHYCAHYNAHRAARILLEHERRVSRGGPSILLEIPDFNEKLPIHVAVARSSSDVLRELLHGGARVDTRMDVAATVVGSPPILAAGPLSSPTTPPRIPPAWIGSPLSHHTPTELSSSYPPAVVTPVSSPVLRSMIPPRPILSSKPWNCVTQESINQCRALIREAELNWCPERHSLFHPTDRRAVMELLRVGKRLEQMGTGLCIYDIWPSVLSFCGRGWFEPDENKAHEHVCGIDIHEPSEAKKERAATDDDHDDNDERKPAARNDDDRLQCDGEMQTQRSRTRSESEEVHFTQFQLE